MIQRFIELGEGYSDIYELFEIAKNNKGRLAHLIVFETEKNGKQVLSFAAVLHPTSIGDFRPIYICREGITAAPKNGGKRLELFNQLALELDKEIITLKVKPSNIFAETQLYYQYLIGILRLNRYIPVMQ